MQDTKLFTYLLSLSPHELNRLSKFMQSRVFNDDERLAKLLHHLLPSFKKGEPDKHNREQIWKHLFCKAPYNDLKFRRLCSDLVLKVESFLAFEQYQHHPATEMHYLMLALNEKKLSAQFAQVYTYTQKLQQRTPHRDADFFLRQYQTELQHATHLEQKNLRSTQKNLFEAMHALDAFYLVSKLRMCAAILHYQTVVKLEGELPLLRELMAHTAIHIYKDVSAVGIYRLILLTLTDGESEQHFDELNTQLRKHHAQFPKLMARDMYAFALNYCVRQINRGKSEYLKKTLELYKHMLKTELLLEGNALSQFDYKNITTTALRVKDFAFAEKFIHDYVQHLPKQERENAYTFNMARLFFYRKKYDKVLPLLQAVEYDDVFYQLDSKTTLMKSYYELREYSALMSLKESFSALLRRKKLISEQHRINYTHFIRFTMKLFRADVRDKKKLRALQQEIEAAQHVADKAWVREKVEEML